MKRIEKVIICGLCFSKRLTSAALCQSFAMTLPTALKFKKVTNVLANQGFPVTE